MTTRFPNKNLLTDAASPYLRQHADNPVHWYPWSELAFERARREDKPIFLSIGYSTCHWCHVMERESFEDPDIARILNAHFVAVKVDREEHPVVDKIYMDAVVGMTGQGGWPLNVFLTPDGKPFFGGTYFPPEGRWGRPGFKDVLLRIVELWRNDRAALLRSADAITAHLKRAAASSTDAPAGPVLNETVLADAADAFKQRFDHRYGGFGGAPKFPTPHNLLFLLRQYDRTGDPDLLAMVTTTLTAMANGGIRDHIGGGFHRYSTDRYWNIPHYEKMLYDQALISMAYLEAYQITRTPLFEEAAVETIDFVLDEMRLDNGAFVTAFDADSLDPQHPQRMEEGAFYLWRREEIEDVLTRDEWNLFQRLYTPITESGEHAWERIDDRRVGLRRSEQTFEEIAASLNITRDELNRRRTDVLNKLKAVRARRPRPMRDDKVLADLNGLMIAALSLGARVLDRPRYLEAARHARDTVLRLLKRDDGRLWHRWFEGRSGVDASLDDVAFMIWGLLNLYEAGGDPDDLNEAVRLFDLADEDFFDENSMGYRMAGGDTRALIVTPMHLDDGAVPNGQAVMVWNLLRLGRMLADPAKAERALNILHRYASMIQRFPTAHTAALIALDFGLGPDQEIIIAADQRHREQAFHEIVNQMYLPRAVLITIPAGAEQRRRLIRIAPYLRHHIPIDDQATAYICRNHECLLPTTDPLTARQNLLNTRTAP